mmetsp:Transcript_22060/g.48915  ORF Transcript_22060/g.48915 Transcript_22060/m.48915 type:complete len:548 (-) Transcript_22060:342-1985(-)|eukprot:CAMPEP_0201270526 /NCGR_PEP_ID=MMETSP0853-20130426/35768_1 /ASSEMBLY_ACC=CAM_ASM_000640 /TAXON_ID=183588 /ORGANISM="Pseudo-nitzschia fraudulenta, Strain WWA7" /LENGTH=547 /DNA_ID=CAMNT_0047576831 /DNA_START=272 /DNA_END=1915 /DNA_ORIENTATION=-
MGLYLPILPWWILVFVLVVVGSNNNNSDNCLGLLSVVHADETVSNHVSIPKQILAARVPPSESKNHRQQERQQLWLYEGALYDPLDGRQVAKVQGLELVRPLDDTTNLAIDSLLKHPNATYEDAKTVWSQKIFCYTKPPQAGGGTSDDNPPPTQETILNSVRVRPQSPRKEVPLDQAVAVYETATTFISRKCRSHNEIENIDGDDDEILVHSEFPNGQTMWGEASDFQQQVDDTRSIDFTVFAKLRNRHSRLYAPDLIRDDDDFEKPKQKSSKSGDVVISPKRAALVQFGSSSGTMETKHKFGARETYSYRNIPLAPDQTRNHDASKGLAGWFPWLLRRNSPRRASNDGSPTKTKTGASLYYTRYGEGPPFYAPGRMCMLELRGRPIGSLGEATSLLRGLLLHEASSGPIVNLHWKDNREETDEMLAVAPKQERRKPGTLAKAAIAEIGNSKAPPPTIQTAWNLRVKNNRYTSDKKGRDKVASLGGDRQKSNLSTQKKQQFLLRLEERIPDDEDGNNNLRAWTRYGKKRALAVWDRIRASTTMESGN